MKWAAGIIFFDDGNSLDRCLDSIHEHMDVMFCIDGKFREYRADHSLSTDGSRDVVLSYPNSILIDAANSLQVEKRNKYLELAGEYDIEVMIHIDSDEYVVGDLRRFKQCLESTLNIGAVRPSIYNLIISTTRHKHTFTVSRPRIYHKPELLRLLSIRHYTLYDTTTRPPTSLRADSLTLHGIELHHDDSLREESWLANMFEHQKWQILYELQWHYRNQGAIKDHVKEYGFDNLELLILRHPILGKILDNYEYRNASAEYSHHVNPEFVEFVDLLKTALSDL
ncbi:MAG: hypothetical protein ACW99U_15895 [Candidatus Thorarchaeota archaeon]|jgi:hypothetical protein